MARNYIHSSKLYKVRHSYCVLGQWREEDIIVVGRHMRIGGYHLEPYIEYCPDPKKRYRLHDGHLPGHQPTCDGNNLRQCMISDWPGINIAEEIS